jgi:hypothetical protein
MARPCEPGRNVYGVNVGVVMLNTRFPRPRGDVGNARTFDFPVAYEIAEGVTASTMLGGDDTSVVPDAAAAGARLVARGVRAVATSCGLMAKYQPELAQAVGAPVMSSSMLQLPMVLRMLPGTQRVVLLTFDAAVMADGDHLAAVGLTDDEIARVVVVGMDRAAVFRATILGQDRPLDEAVVAAEVLDQLRPVVRGDRQIGGVVFECTNLAPYSDRVREEFGLPVWDIRTGLNWLAAGYGDH